MLTPKHLRVCALVLAVSASVSSPFVMANMPTTASTTALPPQAQPDTDQLIRLRDKPRPSGRGG